MGARALCVAIVVAVALGGCDRGDEPPPVPTVPESIPPEPDTEACDDLVDAALGLLQGQLDALAGARLDDLAGGSVPPAIGELEPRNQELAARADELCSPGELDGLVGARLGELVAAGPLAERYLELLAEEFSG